MSKIIGKILILVGFLDFGFTIFGQPLIHKYSPFLLCILGALFIVPMRDYIKFADTLSTSVGKAFSWCIVILMGGTCYEVTMAYVFNKPTLWNFDFSMQMYGAILMMSGAYCLATESHVRGDVIYRLFKPRTQGYIDLVLYFIFFFPGVIPLAFYGY